jgi:hypothetical protein
MSGVGCHPLTGISASIGRSDGCASLQTNVAIASASEPAFGDRAATLEYGRLRRALGDLTARVVAEVDRPGVTMWGFDRLGTA